MNTTDSSPPIRAAEKSSPSRGRFGRRLSTLLVAGTIVLCGLHSYAIWRGLEGWGGIQNGWPLWRDDHSLYFHAAVVTRPFLERSWTTAGYDPFFMAGYPKSVVWPASSTLPEVVLALRGEMAAEVAYKLYVLGAAALIPWLIATSAWLWRMGPATAFLGVGLYLVYIWTDFPINYAPLGMLPYLLGIPLGLVAVGCFVRYCERGSPWFWLATASTMALAALVHFTTVMIVAPTALIVYAAMVRERRRVSLGPADRAGWARDVGVAALPVVVLASNAFWWAPGFWLAGTKGRSDFAFSHPEGLLARLHQIIFTEPLIQPILWPIGLAGLVWLTKRWRLGGAGLTGFALAGFFWGYAASSFRMLDFLQPGRHTYAFYSALSVAGGYALVRGVAWVRGRAGLAAAVALAAILAAGGGFALARPVQFAIETRFYLGMPFLSSRPTRPLVWVLTRVKRHVRPGERLLYEEGGFFPPHVIDPYMHGRFSGFLASTLGIEVLGGPYLHASLATNFTQFGEGKLFGKAISRDQFVRYARLYRPSAILCWSEEAREFCKGNPDLIEIKEEAFPFLIARVRGFEGAAIEGRAEVKASPGRLEVRRAEGGVDGSIVLRYHSVPCLRSEPPVAWQPVYLEDDPVPFIKLLRPPAGPVTFELRIPPGSRGAPVR